MDDTSVCTLLISYSDEGKRRIVRRIGRGLGCSGDGMSLGKTILSQVCQDQQGWLSSTPGIMVERINDLGQV